MLSLKIAWRFLTSSKFQTVLIVLGIAVGVSVQVFVGSLIQSLQKDLVDATVGRSSHVTVTPAKGYHSISNWHAIVGDMEANAAITAVSVSADSPGLLVKGNGSLSVVVRGFDFGRADAIYDSSGSTTGSIPSGINEIAVGKEAATELELSVGDKPYIVTSTGTSVQCTVTGIFDLKASALNRQWVLATLVTSQQLFGFGSNVTSVESQVSDVFKADKVSAEIGASIGSGVVVVKNWKDDNQQLLTALNSQGSSSYMIQGFVLVSVVIGIASVLAISVVQKSRQIGILKAMGIKDGEASRIFLFQGLILGLASAVLGVIAGVALLLMFLNFAKNPDGTPVIQIYIDYMFVLLSGVIAVVASMVASLIPARKSSRLNPIEVIRNG